MDIFDRFKTVWNNNNNTNIEAPVQYSNNLTTPEQIIQATQQFNNRDFSRLKAAKTDYFGNIFGDIDEHKDMYQKLSDELKSYYKDNGEPRGYTDIAKNFAGGFDIAQRLADLSSQEDLTNAGRYYQWGDADNVTPKMSYIDALFNNPVIPQLSQKQINRQGDSILDYIENKAGIDAAYENMKAGGDDPFKNWKNYPQIKQMAIEYANRAKAPTPISNDIKSGLLKKKGK